MKFKGKLMNETWENEKKTYFGPDISGFYLYQMLDINARYHVLQFQGKLMNRTWENGKINLVSGLVLAPLTQMWIQKGFSKDFTSTRNYTMLLAIIGSNFKEN